jgi:hypothetical protein
MTPKSATDLYAKAVDVASARGIPLGDIRCWVPADSLDPGNWMWQWAFNGKHWRMIPSGENPVMALSMMGVALPEFTFYHGMGRAWAQPVDCQRYEDLSPLAVLVYEPASAHMASLPAQIAVEAPADCLRPVFDIWRAAK